MSSRIPKGMTGIEYLLELNKENSETYCNPGTALERRLYRAQHPTEIGVLKCMDGRLHAAVMTNTALGILQPWRNLGGRFNLGWIAFQQSIESWVKYAVHRGRHCLILVTYHYARGNTHRGCRGFNYDADEAQRYTHNLKQQFDRVFGTNVVYTLQCGIETDYESLILHGSNGEMVDMADVIDTSTDALVSLLSRLYPNMPQAIVPDVIPLLQGNIQHIAKIRSSNRPDVEAEHREWVLGVGRGFDWLHEINMALIVGPFDPYLADAIATAATLIKGNLDEGRISKDTGVVLLSSAPYRDPAGPERLLAQEKALFLDNFALDVIGQRVPELIPYLRRLVVTIDHNTRAVDVLERHEKDKH
ncbi:hypothetical protein HZA86_03540 [Candidatus Uhrbacteria bacterium]|nr:hypothetical protein [Candidatus Uhrbacteria bacterium]